MAVIIEVSDLPAALQTQELVDAMVAGANAKASRVAPCLTWAGATEAEPAPTEGQVAEAKLVLIGAVKRWAEAGAGALQAQTAGPYSITLDTRQKAGFNLWPSEIADLQAICRTVDADTGKAFAVDTLAGGSVHADTCSLNFGATYCSCGADIAGFPLYGG